MDIGLVGLPNAGKSTLFNALTKAGAATAEYAFTTVEPNIGVAPVPDSRLTRLAEIFEPKKVIPAIIRFVDIAGLIKGASRGEGLGNQFLGHIGEVDLIVQVVRCFNAGFEATGQAEPLDDIETIMTELALADLASCEKRSQRLAKLAKTGDKEAVALADRLNELISHLSSGRPAATYPGIEDFTDLHLLTVKPMIFAANINEDEYRRGDHAAAESVCSYAAEHGCDTIIVSAKVESELAELDEDDAELFRIELGLSESGLDKLIRAAYHTLGLRSFFTAGDRECRAWTIKTGRSAREAAGKIHTDFARGFVKAEVTPVEALIADGSYSAAKEAGHTRLEGKDYVVNDGDVVIFKFNV